MIRANGTQMPTITTHTQARCGRNAPSTMVQIRMKSAVTSKSFSVISRMPALRPDSTARVYAIRFRNILIFIESMAGFLAQPSRINHFDQEGTGAVFRIPESVVHHPHDIEADIESDEIRQRQGPHGMR